MDRELAVFLLLQGYMDIRDVPGRGMCAIRALVPSGGDILAELSFSGIGVWYRYNSLYDARLALLLWDGERHPPGPWVELGKDGRVYPNPELPGYDRMPY